MATDDATCGSHVRWSTSRGVCCTCRPRQKGRKEGRRKTHKRRRREIREKRMDDKLKDYAKRRWGDQREVGEKTKERNKEKTEKAKKK